MNYFFHMWCHWCCIYFYVDHTDGLLTLPGSSSPALQALTLRTSVNSINISLSLPQRLLLPATALTFCLFLSQLFAQPSPTHPLELNSVLLPQGSLPWHLSPAQVPSPPLHLSQPLYFYFLPLTIIVRCSFLLRCPWGNLYISHCLSS